MENGNKTEYLVFLALKGMGLKNKVCTTYKNIAEKCKNTHHCSNMLISIKNTLQKSLIFNNIQAFKFETCRNNLCSTADIILFSRDREKFRLSIKHNNSSIKHHRPQNLCSQMKISRKHVVSAFEKAFIKINEKWYNKW